VSKHVVAANHYSLLSTVADDACGACTENVSSNSSAAIETNDNASKSSFSPTSANHATDTVEKNAEESNYYLIILYLPYHSYQSEVKSDCRFCCITDIISVLKTFFAIKAS